MNTTQVTSTGIAVALAVVLALGLLFFGPRVFAPFSPQDSSTASLETATTTAPTSMTSSLSNLAPVPNPLPTTFTVTDTQVGTGEEAVPGKQVAVHYVGMLPDGTVFDTSLSRGEPFVFTLGAGQVIAGWDQGVAGMKVDGTRRLVIPADLAYGSRGAGGVIPPGATLIFDVQLLDVQ